MRPDSVEVPVAELKALAQKNQLAAGEWSRGKRTFVLLTVLIAPALLGAGALFASDGPRTSLLGWLSSVSSVTSQIEAEPKAQALSSVVQPADATVVPPAQDTALPSAIQAIQEPAPSANYSQLERRIEALAQGLAALQEKIETLGATQEQTAREIVKLRELEQDFRKLQATSAAQAVPNPPRKKTSTLAPLPPATTRNIAKPRWYMVDARFARRLKQPITLQQLKTHASLRDLALLRRGNRLSVMPVSVQQWEYILSLE
jgi:hypothetical protein